MDMEVSKDILALSAGSVKWRYTLQGSRSEPDLTYPRHQPWLYISCMSQPGFHSWCRLCRSRCNFRRYHTSCLCENTKQLSRIQKRNGISKSQVYRVRQMDGRLDGFRIYAQTDTDKTIQIFRQNERSSAFSARISFISPLFWKSS